MYQKSTLENGIRVVTEQMDSVRSVAMGIIVDTGKDDEFPRKNGRAHLLEHLMFQGTRRRDSLQIARFMDEAGGCIGGFTTRDYTCYSATVLDDYRTFALELFGDILLDSVFMAEDIEREKKAILREIDAQNDLPDQRVDNLLKAHTWTGHPLGSPVAGERETISGLTREDIISFFQSHYRPDSVIIAAAGHIEHQDFVAQAQDAFWKMMGQAAEISSPPLEYHAGVAVEHVPVSQVYFSVGIPACAYAHTDRYGLHMLNKVLGDGISSRLFRRIREELGLVYHIGSQYQAYRDGGLLVIEGSTKPGFFQQVLEQTIAVLSNLISGTEPVLAEELLRVKNQIKGQHLIAAEDTNTRMSRLATQEFYFGRHISTREIVKQIDAIDIQGLEDIAQQRLATNLSKAAIAVVGPEASDRYDVMVDQAMQAYLH